jgi:hypothetical protein
MGAPIFSKQILDCSIEMGTRLSAFFYIKFYKLFMYFVTI